MSKCEHGLTSKECLVCASPKYGAVASGGGSEVNDDVIDAIVKVRHAFLRVNMKPPTVILLESHHEGMRFLSAVRQTTSWSAVVGSPEFGHLIEMADGSAWMELQIADIKIRWPANRIAMPDGSWSYA